MSEKQHKVGTIDDLAEDGDRIVTTINGNEVGIFRIDGEIYAAKNYCPHEKGPLCEGDIRGQFTKGDDGWNWKYENDGKIIECPWHGWLFDITTGENIDSDKYRVPTYETEVTSDGDIFVELY